MNVWASESWKRDILNTFTLLIYNINTMYYI